LCLVFSFIYPLAPLSPQFFVLFIDATGFFTFGQDLKYNYFALEDGENPERCSWELESGWWIKDAGSGLGR